MFPTFFHHISRVVKEVKVRIESVDLDSNRMSLSMREGFGGGAWHGMISAFQVVSTCWPVMVQNGSLERYFLNSEQRIFLDHVMDNVMDFRTI